ncbi:MAG: formimidoylglutamase [Bacteroidia bacterium]|nr:formimidoylglutamase [Bacteroidia bacterium]
MDIKDFFSPIDLSLFNDGEPHPKNALGYTIQIFSNENNFPELENVQLAILGVEDDRNAVNNQGCGQASTYIREYLYKLNNHQLNSPVKAKIVDLGNIRQGHTVDDTYFAVSSACAQLISQKIIPIIIGGGNDIAFAQYQAYEKLSQTINMVSVDQNFDLGDADETLNSKTYLGKIILQQPNYLFNYSNIGYQTYFIDSKELDLMSKLFFDVYRLGQVQAKIEEVEPVIRNADMMIFDISSIRQSDAPGCYTTTPNGFYGEEACQITRYAGMSDKLTSIGIYEINPKKDKGGQTCHLAAQMIWYFMEGFCNRKHDFPFKSGTDYTKYRVVIKDSQHELVFYKSNKSDRWWMEVPYPPDKRLKFERHYWVPCSYDEYKEACNDEMPDRWWQTFQKLG